jgi:hypothetical protein
MYLEVLVGAPFAPETAGILSPVLILRSMLYWLL